MRTPRVSVVMATRNYARYLPQALESVRAQTVTDWELWVVDDGSSDQTASLLSEYQAKDRRIHGLISDRLGQPRAKNLGERCARAPVIAYLDADDAWLPGKLAAQLEVLEQNPRCGVVFTGRSLMDDRGQPLTANPEQTHTDYPQGRIGPALFLRNQICFSSVMIRKVVFDHLGGFDPQLDLAIDYDFWLRVSNHYDFQALAEPWTIYRTGHANLSGKQLDRVATAEYIMTRACRRGILGLSKSDRAEGFASLYRAAAYTLRGIESATARAWARRALGANPRRLFSWKLWLSTYVPRRTAATRPENRTENR